MISISTNKKAAILNSRQNLRPLGSDAWILTSDRAMKDAVEKGCTILTSAGMNSWEMVLYFGSVYKAPMVIYMPIEDGGDTENIKQNICLQFHLQKDLIDWRFIKINSYKKDKHLFQQKRDESIIKEADILYPVSVRCDGNMKRLLGSKLNKNAEIIDTFKIGYQEKNRSYKIEIDTTRLNHKINHLLNEYIIHWTRASNKTWPRETKYEYYNDIVQSHSVYPRDGLATLKRIVGSKKLIASSRHYRKDTAAVAFSSLPPSEAGKLMRWRARYREMSFEPYGVAVEKDFAEIIGIRKVIYGQAGEYKNLGEVDKPYFQSIGKRGDWMPEKEYRYIGDLQLDRIPEDKLIVIVRLPDEIGAVQKIFDNRVVSFFDNV